MTETYDKTEAQRINNLDCSELGEGGPFLEFDYPENLTYDEFPVTDLGYDGRGIYMEYDTTSADHQYDWDYIRFQTEMRDDGTIVITRYSAGVMSAKEVYETNPEAPHARSLEPIYDALYEAGVRFADMDD